MICAKPTRRIAMKILVASDGSPASDAAIAEVSSRAWPKGSEIKVLSAFELPLPAASQLWAIPANYFAEMDLAARELAQTIAAHAADTLKSRLGDDVTVRSEFASGPAQDVILEEANRWGADLIVVGSHGYGSLERLLLGSISQAVVSQAKCSVEVVRPPASTTKVSRSH
jgi:nucleotide-binding universal stress UspA family protein